MLRVGSRPPIVVCSLTSRAAYEHEHEHEARRSQLTQIYSAHPNLVGDLGYRVLQMTGTRGRRRQNRKSQSSFLDGNAIIDGVGTLALWALVGGMWHGRIAIELRRRHLRHISPAPLQAECVDPEDAMIPVMAFSSFSVHLSRAIKQLFSQSVCCAKGVWCKAEPWQLGVDIAAGH